MIFLYIWLLGFPFVLPSELKNFFHISYKDLTLHISKLAFLLVTPLFLVSF